MARKGSGLANPDDLVRYVDATGPCWLWTHAISSTGYGTVKLGGRKAKAHRVVWELLVGEIPEGLVVDHMCRVRRCVNPDHLRLVTPRVNSTENISGSSVARNALKSHCVNGHPFSAANTRVRPDGSRRCRACHSRATSRGSLRDVRSKEPRP